MQVVILPNGITSLLISTVPYDVSTDGSESKQEEWTEEEEDGEAGAALCIGVGSFSDPVEIPGFAHFMEHMVFMGSKKYPKENHWDDYLAKHGGESNAWTDCERGAFHKALDIFAQFFISPLFGKNSVDREIMAVDNECNLMSSRDSERMRNILADCVVEDGHPMKKFMAGNKKSLKDDPEKNEINVYDMLQTFYKNMYTAQYMTLVVYSLDDLDTMEEKVIKIFSKIPNNQIPHPRFIKPPFQEKNFNKFIKVVPVEDVHRLDLVWAFPPLKEHYKTRVIEFLAVLLGHEGRGSIISYLKKKHYALEVAAGNDMTGFTHNSTCTSFLVSIKLTDQGKKALHEVLKTVFQYIELLKHNIPAHIFEEQKHIEETKYIFHDLESVYNYVEEVAENMHIFPPEHYLCGRKMYFEYNEQLIKDCVHFLRPEGMLMVQYDKSFMSLPGLREEPWLGSKYNITDFDRNLLSKLSNLSINPTLKLPDPNPYISTNFSILTGKRATKYPVVLYNEEGCRIWFKKDSKFHTPKAYMYFNLISSAISKNSKNLTLGDVYLTMLLQRLTEILYSATLAGYEYFVEGTPEGIVLIVGGYNEKIKLMVENMLTGFISLEVEADSMTAILSHLRQIYINELMKPLELARALRYSLLEENDASILERYDELDFITLDDLKGFVHEFHNSLFIEGYLAGNLKPQDAVDIGELASKVVQKSLPPTDVPKPNMLELPMGEHTCLVSTINKDDPNACVMQYYQQGLGTFFNTCLNDILAAAMSEPLFNQLRTEKQLGYSVFCQSATTHGVLGFLVVVESQAKLFKMQDIDKMITTFLKSFEEILEHMPEAKFYDLVSNQAMMHSPEDADLVDESTRMWGEIAKQTYIFDRADKEQKVIEKITQKDLINWYKDTILGKKKRKLCIMVEGCVSYPNCPSSSALPSSPSPSVKSVMKSLRTCVPNVAKPWLIPRDTEQVGDRKQKGDQAEKPTSNHSLAPMKTEGSADYIDNIDNFKSTLDPLPYHVINE